MIMRNAKARSNYDGFYTMSLGFTLRYFRRSVLNLNLDSISKEKSISTDRSVSMGWTGLLSWSK